MQLREALITGMDIAANRPALLQSIDIRFVASFTAVGNPAAQLMVDIGLMNETERLPSGVVPLQVYLQNAAFLLYGKAGQEATVRNLLDVVNQRAMGAPKVDISSIPETKEQIIHQDDMVTFAFMENGVKAAPAVLKLKVPQFENGQPRKLSNGEQLYFLGTGWLVAPSLVMTNHHVINARKEGEANAAEADLRLQAAGTAALLDFDADEMEPGSTLQAQALEAWNTQLDYAVIRIPDTGRPPLRLAAQMLEYGNEPIPVNIIQHPGGRGKRYAIRNNLVSSSTPAELRYFTDTEAGTSGSPVFNDRWEVVALHRASKYVSGVQFQGKATAYVNVGTHLPLIVADIKARYAALAGEMGL
jgi:V8-like Glu-specific endopeptidase